MSKSAIEFIRHIFDETEFIINNTSSVSFSDFMDNEVLQRAIIRSLEIIGEASKKVDVEFKNQFPEIEWRNMSQMRDKLIHHYFVVDYEIVWDVVKNRIPGLNSQLKIALEN